MEEVQPCLHQAQKKGQGPEILCHFFCPCQSLVQFSLCFHPACIVSAPSCAPAGAALMYPGSHLEPVLGLSSRGCYRENVQMNRWTNVCYWETGLREAFYFKDFIFRQKGKEGEREKHQCVVASRMLPIGNLACNPGMCPVWELNWQPLVCRPALSPLSHTSQGPHLS